MAARAPLGVWREAGRIRIAARIRGRGIRSGRSALSGWRCFARPDIARTMASTVPPRRRTRGTGRERCESPAACHSRTVPGRRPGSRRKSFSVCFQRPPTRPRPSTFARVTFAEASNRSGATTGSQFTADDRSCRRMRYRFRRAAAMSKAIDHRHAGGGGGGRKRRVRAGRKVRICPSCPIRPRATRSDG